MEEKRTYSYASDWTKVAKTGHGCCRIWFDVQSDNVAFVARFINQLEQHCVDTKKASCSCETWKQHKISYRHLIATLRVVDKPKIAYKLMGNCYKVAAYQASVGTLEVAEYHVLKRSLNTLPAVYIRQAGRPKKIRIGSQGESGGKSRKPYKCKRCGTSGHNKATCCCFWR